MNQDLAQFIFSTFREPFDYMRPRLSNYLEFSKSLGKVIKVKENENEQFSFDVEIDKIVKQGLESFGITGRIYSEESGFYDSGKPKYRVVYDPFCNSSLASTTFHEAAMGISIFSYEYEFITSAILDYQTGIVGIVEGGKTNYYQIQTLEKINFQVPSVAGIEDARVVITLENKAERNNMHSLTTFLQKPKRLFISSGHIYWLKLAMGFIDAYIDPIGGEKLYEMFACTVAQYSGCVVTDKMGEVFDPVKYLKIFESDKDFIYYPVGARSNKLHEQILTLGFPSSAE